MTKDKKKTTIENIMENSRDSPWDKLSSDDKDDIHLTISKKDLEFLQTLKEQSGITMSEYMHMLISTVRPESFKDSMKDFPPHIREHIEKRRKMVSRKYFKYCMEERKRLYQESKHELEDILHSLEDAINTDDTFTVEAMAEQTHELELDEYPVIKEKWYSLLEENGYEIPEKEKGLFDN